MAGLCELMGVDVENVRRGIGSDSRIGFSFIYPGCGYGGSCFPKDVQALIRMAQQVDFEPQVLQSVEERNQFQKGWFGRQLRRHFGDDLSALSFGVWGLAFKPGTDDMRESSAKVLIADLIAAGARVLAYDPVAMETAARELPSEWFDSGQLRLVDHQYQALEDVDAMLLVTEWKPFRNPDLDAMRRIMKQQLIIDGRNQYDPAVIRGAGFGYVGVGRLV
jgi:UDPglucose 6-dehydrogenase